VENIYTDLWLYCVLARSVAVENSLSEWPYSETEHSKDELHFQALRNVCFH